MYHSTYGGAPGGFSSPTAGPGYGAPPGPGGIPPGGQYYSVAASPGILMPGGDGMDPRMMGSVAPVEGKPWKPLPADQPYYETLFVKADVSRMHDIGGKDAVIFMSKSGLPKPQLSQIWMLADRRKRNNLDRVDFAYACRLIALAQNGQPIGPGAVEATADWQIIPRFEGIDLPATLLGDPAAVVPVAPMPSAVSGATPIGTADEGADPWSTTPSDREKYTVIFRKSDADNDGYLTGAEAASFFKQSGLPRDDLSKIWALSDMDKDGRLDLAEFIVAMHLSIRVAKSGLPVPSSIPSSLLPPSKKALFGAVSDVSRPSPTLAPTAAPTSIPMNDSVPLAYDDTMTRGAVISPTASLYTAALPPAAAPISTAKAPEPSASMPVRTAAPAASRPTVARSGSVSGGLGDSAAVTRAVVSYSEMSEGMTSELESNAAYMDSTAASLRSQASKWTAALEKQRERKDKAAQALRTAKVEIDQLLSSIATTTDALAAETREADDIEREISSLRMKLKSLMDDKLAKMELLSEEKSKASHLRSELKDLEREGLDLNKAIAELQAERDKLQEQVDAATADGSSISSDLLSLDSTRLGHVKGKEANDSEISALKKSLNEKKKYLTRLRAENQVLQEKVVSQRDTSRSTKRERNAAESSAREAAMMYNTSEATKKKLMAEHETTDSEIRLEVTSGETLKGVASAASSRYASPAGARTPEADSLLGKGSSAYSSPVKPAPVAAVAAAAPPLPTRGSPSPAPIAAAPVPVAAKVTAAPPPKEAAHDPFSDFGDDDGGFGADDAGFDAFNDEELTSPELRTPDITRSPSGATGFDAFGDSSFDSFGTGAPVVVPLNVVSVKPPAKSAAPSTSDDGWFGDASFGGGLVGSKAHSVASTSGFSNSGFEAFPSNPGTPPGETTGFDPFAF